MFISLEGIDGSGKTTQAKLLAAELGAETVLVREPGGTAAGERIRQLLTDAKVPLEGFAELLLFLAARSQLVEEVISPAREAGRTVVCDRFSDSSIAYQGAARGIGTEVVRDLCDAATGGLWPELTVLLRVDPELAAKRARGRDRFEAEGLAFQAAVAEGYEEIARAEPGRVRVVEAVGSIDQVHAAVMAELERVRV